MGERNRGGSQGHSHADLQRRLSRRVDAADRGEILEKTRKALEYTDPVRRLTALVAALAHERVIVPALIEGAEECTPQSRHAIVGGEEATLAFTSVAALHRWDPRARPVPVPARRHAMLALAETEGRIVVDLADDGGVRLPRPAVVALSVADQWVAPWEDRELREELSRAVDPKTVAYVSLSASPEPTQVVTIGVRSRAERPAIDAAVAAIATHPRLLAACERVEIRPVLAQLA